MLCGLCPSQDLTAGKQMELLTAMQRPAAVTVMAALPRSLALEALLSAPTDFAVTVVLAVPRTTAQSILAPVTLEQATAFLKVRPCSACGAACCPHSHASFDGRMPQS